MNNPTRPGPARSRGRRRIAAAVVLACGLFAVRASAHDVGSNGFDGALTLTPGQTLTIDLSLAPDGLWDTSVPDRNLAGHVPGDGIYDKTKWAVVFHYTSVTVPATARVEFVNHEKYPPVVWLVQGDVTIGGEVDLDGEDAFTDGPGNFQPGPGGFRGGNARLSCTSAERSAGLGPGGGQILDLFSLNGAAGSYGTTGGSPPGQASGDLYGNPQILPLVGGSGGAADGDCSFGSRSPGGAGGGAILIAANGTIDVNGLVHADGGSGTPNGPFSSGMGSGGAIRLVGEVVQGDGSLRASGYTPGDGFAGGAGRIRVEGNTVTLTNGDPPIDPFDLDGAEPQIWPDELTAPSITITEVDSVPVPDPQDPGTAFQITDPDLLRIANTGNVIAKLTAVKVPASWTVVVRVVPRSGQDFKVSASCDTADDPCPAWTSDPFQVPDGFTNLQARATAP